MAEMQGMLAVTPELEAQGRMGDTEVGTIDIDALVLPKDVLELDEAQEFLSELGNLYNQFDLDMSNFTVSAGNTNYSIEENNTQAHLTNGELVIPPGILQAAEGLTDILSELYTLAESNINQYTVGNEANSINPETGLPEFGFFSGITRIIKKVTKPIKSIFDKAKDAVSSALKAVKKIGSSVLDVGKKVLASPVGMMVLSSIPAMAPYAKYITAISKAASGSKLTAADFLSLGVSGYNDITGSNFKIDPNVVKGINAVERIQDGADIKDVLISSYGGDFAKTLGLDAKVKESLSGVVGEDNYNWISQNIDFNQAAADLAAGTQPVRLLANQFGDKIANYVGADDPNMKALGYAGIRTAIGLNEGLTPKEALYRGAREYFDKEGKIPSFGDIAGSLDLGKYKDLLPDLNLNMSDLGIDLSVPDWMKSQGDWDFGKLRSMFGDWKGLKDLGFNFGDVDLSMYKPEVDFGDMSFGEVRDVLGDSWKNLDLSEFKGDIKDLILGGLSEEEIQRQKQEAMMEEEDLLARTTDNPLLIDDGVSRARQLLTSLNLGTPV